MSITPAPVTEQPPWEEPRRPPPWKRVGSAIAAAAVVLVKLAAKLKALLVLLPKLKLLTTSGTMLVSVAAYAARNWPDDPAPEHDVAALLRIKPFRRLWLALGGSSFGD